MNELLGFALLNPTYLLYGCAIFAGIKPAATNIDVNLFLSL